jgi:hypothetical protein
MERVASKNSIVNKKNDVVELPGRRIVRRRIVRRLYSAAEP